VTVTMLDATPTQADWAGDRSQSNPSRPGGARAGSEANVHCEVQARRPGCLRCGGSGQEGRDLSLRPSTVKHIQHDLREVGTWVGEVAPDMDSCADLTRTTSRATGVGRRQARPLHRPAAPCASARPGQREEPADQFALLPRPCHERGYPNPPQRPHLHRRPSDRRQAATTVPRRRGRGQAALRLPRRPPTRCPG
jgi:hypothetical protein